MDTSPTIPDPEKTEKDGDQSAVLKARLPGDHTSCGYRPGPLKVSDGTRYVVTETGQIRRLDRKMSKAERKRHKKERAAAARRNP